METETVFNASIYFYVFLFHYLQNICTFSAEDINASLPAHKNKTTISMFTDHPINPEL